jgi:hypothetical protein
VSARARAWAAAAALLLLAVWEIGTLLRVHASAPTDDDWRAAAAAVRAGFQPGDLVVFAPAWIDPVGRKWLGDLDGIHGAARMDAARYARIWEVAARGAAAPDAEGPVGADEGFGALRVRRHDHQAAPVTWDLRARSVLAEVDYAPRDCVPLRPPATLDAGPVPLAGHLVVYAGLADFRARRDNRARARVRVAVDGVAVAERLVGNDDGWAPLPPIATAPGPHRVVFTSEPVPEAGQPINLDLCIAAEARP